jgi:hypothetical protein
LFAGCVARIGPDIRRPHTESEDALRAAGSVARRDEHLTIDAGSSENEVAPGGRVSLLLDIVPRRRIRVAASKTSGSFYHGHNRSIEWWDTTGSRRLSCLQLPVEIADDQAGAPGPHQLARAPRT